MSHATTINTTNRLTIADLSTEIDDEPRVRDLLLGQRLGFSRPRAIRQIIERNSFELGGYGSLATRRGKSRGQAFTEYFLNEGQSLLLCMFSKTEKATAVRKMLIDVFMEYRRARIEKPVSVRPHKRRTSTPIDTAINLSRTARRLEAVADKIQPQMPDMCAMVINGESVFVDIHKFDGAGRAVTLGHDGLIKVEYVEPTTSDYKPMGERFALGERYRDQYGRVMQNGVAVLGMVIEQSQSIAMQPMAMQQMQIEHEPVKRMAVSIGHPNQSAPYRDKILALLGTGLSKTQIAEKVGCSYHGVDYWARKARATSI